MLTHDDETIGVGMHMS